MQTLLCSLLQKLCNHSRLFAVSLLFCRFTSSSSYLPPSLNILFIVTPYPFLFASLPLVTLLPLCALFSNPIGSSWLSPRRTWSSYLFWLLSNSPVKKGKLAEKLLRSFPARQPSLSKPRRLLRCRPFPQSRRQERRDQRCFCPQRSWGRDNCRSNIIELRPCGPSVSSIL